MKNFFTALILLASCDASLAQPYSIGSRTITYNDPARNNRAIATEVYYPAASAGSNVPVSAGEFPVVVFGHGFAMAVGAFQNWREFLVPLGYIVAFPTTEGSLIPAPNHGNFGGDLAFLAQKIQAENANASSPLFNHVLQRAALMGHSMGGGASFLGSSNNTNIKCIVGLAPAETDPLASVAAADVTVPALILHGNSDNVTVEADHALLIFNGLQNSCRNYVRILNGSHCYFANSNFNCDFGETSVGGAGSLSRVQQQAISYAVVEPWLRYFLWDDCSAFADFTNEVGTNPGLGTNILSCPNDAPVIVDNNGALESTVGPNYQWYLDGQPLNGEVQQQHTYSQTGTYQVGVVNVGTCEVLSNEIIISPTGITEDSNAFRLIQNRANVSIQLNSDARQLRTEWIDLSGKLLSSQSFADQKAGATITIALPDYQSLKLLRIVSAENQRVFKVF